MVTKPIRRHIPNRLSLFPRGLVPRLRAPCLAVGIAIARVAATLAQGTPPAQGPEFACHFVKIAVRDDVRHRTITLRAGKKYLARPRR